MQNARASRASGFVPDVLYRRYDGAMRGDGDDVVMWLLRAMCDVLPPGIERTNMLITIERDARLAWGGRRPYVAKRRPACPWLDERELDRSR